MIFYTISFLSVFRTVEVEASFFFIAVVLWHWNSISLSFAYLLIWCHILYLLVFAYHHTHKNHNFESLNYMSLLASSWKVWYNIHTLFSGCGTDSLFSISIHLSLSLPFSSYFVDVLGKKNLAQRYSATHFKIIKRRIQWWSVFE